MSNELDHATYRTDGGRLSISVTKDPRLCSVTIDVKHLDATHQNAVLETVSRMCKTFAADVTGQYDSGKFPLTMSVKAPGIASTFDAVFYS